MAQNLLVDQWTETYKSLVTLSVEGFKFSALANGGAAVALLAYLGNIAGKGGVTPEMQVPMGFFLAGLFSCGVALLYAYLTQLRILNEVAKTCPPKAHHGRFLLTSILAYVSSLACFGVGAWQAVNRF